MFLTGQAEVHSLCRRLRKAFPFRKGNTNTGACLPLYTPTYCMFKCAFIYLNIFWIGQLEEFDSSEAIRKFKKAKQKKTVVSVLTMLLELYVGLWHKCPSQMYLLKWKIAFPVSSLYPELTWITTLPSQWMREMRTAKQELVMRRMEALTWTLGMIPPVQVSLSRRIYVGCATTSSVLFL